MFRRRALRKRLERAGATAAALEERGLLTALARAAAAGAGGGCVRAAAPCVRLAALRAWRWPELRDPSEVRRLPPCPLPDCCNPWHWSRLCKPESPPPPYSRLAPPVPPAAARAHPADADVYSPDDEVGSAEVGKVGERVWSADARRTDHERPAAPAGSLATDGGEDRLSWESEWCRLAYWELARRVGCQVGVRPRAVHVQGGGGGGGEGSLCLGALLAPQPVGTAPAGAPPPPPAPPPEQVRRTRAKIGLGVTLSLETDGVWLYNRSEQPVFVSSPALDAAAAAARALLVWRVPPAHCMRVAGDPRAPPAPPPRPARAPLGPVDARSVRISFAKGWGPKYSRRDVTACPCWLEVMLAPPPPPS